MSLARDFYRAVLPPPAPLALRLTYGTIPATYTSGRPTVQFDGEDAPSTRAYPYLGDYTPAAGDRVALLKSEAGYLILGKVT